MINFDIFKKMNGAHFGWLIDHRLQLISYTAAAAAAAAQTQKNSGVKFFK